MQRPWHGGPGVDREVGVQAGGRAEGQAGPAAQQDVDSREARRAEDDEQEPTLGETAVMGCELGGTVAGAPRSCRWGPQPHASKPQFSSSQNICRGLSIC